MTKLPKPRKPSAKTRRLEGKLNEAINGRKPFTVDGDFLRAAKEAGEAMSWDEQWYDLNLEDKLELLREQIDILQKKSKT